MRKMSPTPDEAKRRWKDHMAALAKAESDELGLQLTAAMTLERHAYEEYRRYSEETDRLIALIPKSDR